MPAISLLRSFLGLIEQKSSEIGALHGPRTAGCGHQPGRGFK